MFFKKKEKLDPNQLYTPWLDFYRKYMQKFFYSPFFMQTQIPDFASDIVNTDKYGLRHTIDANGNVCCFGSPPYDGSVDVLMGGSVSFGWGSKIGDRSTIASFLARNEDTCWLNAGVCGQVLQGNLVHMMFLSSVLKSVNRIVFLGGFNELAAFVNGALYSKTFGCMFEQQKFHSVMNEVTLEEYSQDQLYAGDFLRLPKRSLDKIEVLKSSLKLALDTFAFQSKALGAKPFFILQPFPTWMKRKLLKKEQEIWSWSVERHRPAVKEGFYEDIESLGQWYADFLRNECDARGISFVDLNIELSKNVFASEWLFIDPAHLTDSCNEFVANIISKSIHAQM